MKRTLSVLIAGALSIPLGLQAIASGSGTISINGDSGFKTCGCVTSGTGTAADPYLIEALTISADSSVGVSISNTTKSFDLDHITVHTTDKAAAIVLTNVTGPASITHVNIDSPGTIALAGGPVGEGIDLIASTNVTINGDSINTVSGWGIRVEGGFVNTIQFMTVAHAGLSNPSSKDTAGLDSSVNPWITGITGNATGGVLLRNTSGNSVHDNLLNEDGYVGIELVNATGNSLSKINVRYPDYFGAYLQGSSNNTVDDLSLQTADFDGLLVRASNKNTFTNNTFSANGPIGNEWAAGVVPYFIAGAYVGWGSNGNTFTLNNGNFGNTGPDLVFDDGNVPTPSASVQGGVLQTNNPLNGPGGSDPGGSVVVGKKNVVCGNSFAPNYWFPSSLNANSPC